MVHSKSLIDFAIGGVVQFISLAALLSDPFSKTVINASNFLDKNIITNFIFVMKNISGL